MPHGEVFMKKLQLEKIRFFSLIKNKIFLLFL